MTTAWSSSPSAFTTPPSPVHSSSSRSRLVHARCGTRSEWEDGGGGGGGGGMNVMDCRGVFLIGFAFLQCLGRSMAYFESASLMSKIFQVCVCAVCLCCGSNLVRALVQWRETHVVSHVRTSASHCCHLPCFAAIKSNQRFHLEPAPGFVPHYLPTVTLPMRDGLKVRVKRISEM